MLFFSSNKFFSCPEKRKVCIYIFTSKRTELLVHSPFSSYLVTCLLLTLNYAMNFNIFFSSPLMAFCGILIWTPDRQIVGVRNCLLIFLI